MALIYKFRRLVFYQVLLGIVAFCIAEANPGLLLVAGAVGALSWYVTEGPSGRPLPRWLMNIGALAAVGWLVFDLFRQQGDVVLAMGHFTMWLQILLLYTHKSNREYGQLLVLSLLQMVGASVVSVSMIYGLLLAAYSVLALLTVLMFQFKATSDLILEANRAAAGGRWVARPKPIVSRGHRWHFRFMATTIGLICAAVAVAVFVVTPRSSAETHIPGHEGKAIAREQTGFSQQVKLGSSTPGKGAVNREPALHLSVYQGGQNLGSSSEAWLLRGAALDRYNGRTHTWSRSHGIASRDHTVDLPVVGLTLADLPETHADADLLTAHITLRQASHNILFSLHPAVAIQGENFDRLTFNPVDQQLSAGASANGPPGAVIYTLHAPRHPPADLADRYQQQMGSADDDAAPQPFGNRRRFDPDTYARHWGPSAKRIAAYTQGVLKKHGLSRDPQAPHDPHDAQIAAVLARHLRDNFQYSLDNPVLAEDEDPLTKFLFEQKQGHCELFASALAAMARSINIPARVITGYRASEYNSIGGYYVVRQSNAHAWTEIDGGPGVGWIVLDATPPDAVRLEHHVDRTIFTSLREIYDYMEFVWIRSVVAFDQESREAVIGGIQTSLSQATQKRGGWIAAVVDFFENLPDIWRLDRVSYSIAGVIIAVIGIGVGSLVRTAIIRRRRMAALQLTALPRAKRRGLARRLKFYLDMLNMLERRGYVRPEWQSPFGFAQELAEAYPMRFDPVVSLTELFYEIRFGHRDLDADRKQRIRAHLKQLEHALSQQRSAGSF